MTSFGKFRGCFRIVSSRAFKRRIVRLSAAIRSRVMTWGRLTPPPASRGVAKYPSKCRVKQVAEAKYRRYLLHIFDDFKVNSKRFWSLLKSFKRSSTISTLKDGDRVISDDFERAQCFSRAFVAKFSNPTVTVFPDTVSYDLDKLPQFTVTQDQVLRTLLSIDVHKACGPDGLSGRILSECAHEISVPERHERHCSLRDNES